ncbi:MAG TPA: hypothetical protein VIZ87_02300 [Terrimicrobium sp.]
MSPSPKDADGEDSVATEDTSLYSKLLSIRILYTSKTTSPNRTARVLASGEQRPARRCGAGREVLDELLLIHPSLGEPVMLSEALSVQDLKPFDWRTFSQMANYFGQCGSSRMIAPLRIAQFMSAISTAWRVVPGVRTGQPCPWRVLF